MLKERTLKQALQIPKEKLWRLEPHPKVEKVQVDRPAFGNKTVFFKSQLRSQRLQFEQEVIDEPICYTIVNHP